MPTDYPPIKSKNIFQKLQLSYHSQINILSIFMIVFSFVLGSSLSVNQAKIGQQFLIQPAPVIRSSPSPSPSSPIMPPFNQCYKPCDNNTQCQGLVCGDVCKPSTGCATIYKCYNPKCPYDNTCLCTGSSFK